MIGANKKNKETIKERP